MHVPRSHRRRITLVTALGGALSLTSGCSSGVASPAWHFVWATAVIAMAVTGIVARRASHRLRSELEKRARELETSEERHRLLLAQASDAILVADADTGVIIEANQCASDLLGWNEKDLVGRRHTTVHQNSERELVRSAFIAHSKRGGIVEEDTYVMHRSGERIPVNARATLVTAGAQRYMQVIMRDLRPRLQAEQALRRSETQLRELLEHVPVAIIEEDFTAPAQWLESLRSREIADIAEFLRAHPHELAEQFARIRITSANPAALRSAGAPDLDVYRRNLPASVTPSVLKAFQLELEAIWHGRSEITCEITFRRSDGTMCHGVMHWSVHQHGDRPDFTRVVVAISDLTQLRTAEARLREVEDRWELAVRGLNAGIFEQNYLTGETYLSNRWKEMIGFAPDELPTNREAWQSRIHPEDRERVLAALHGHLRRENDFYQIDYRIACKDGSYKWIDARGRAVFGANGEPVRLIGAHADISDRKAAEAALREGEERYRRLFENNPCPMWVYDLETLRFLAVNPAAVRHYGYTGNEFLDMTLFDIRSPEEGERLRRELSRAAKGTSMSGLWRHRKKSGQEMLMHVTTHTHEFAGRPAALALVEDVTERQEAEERLQASEARYRVLFEHSPVAIVEQDYRPICAWLDSLRATGVSDLKLHFDKNPQELAGALGKVVIRDMNRETLRMARASSKQELLENMNRVLTADALAARRDTFLALWEGRHEVEGEISLHALDGSSRRIFYRWWMPKLTDPEAASWAQLVLVDVTEIRTAEAELAAERERLRVTLRAMAEGLLTTDTEGVVQFMNEAAERITGWTSGAAIGRHVSEICMLRHEKTRAEVTIPVTRAISEHRVIDFPLQTMLVSRHTVACQVDGRCAPMHDLAGRAIGAVAVFRDVTERARLEAELLRSSKLESVGILAGGIAHDFNNILTVVMGNVTLAMLDSTVNESVARWLEEAERGVLRARDLTQQLLTFAKGGEPVRKTVRLPEVVRDAAEFALHGSKVRCEFSFVPDLWPADVDKGQIGQVVQNLVINAVQAMPEGGVVRVAISNEHARGTSSGLLAMGCYLKLSISDSGMGIRPDHVARIFDPYFTTKQSGSGLGLATVYSIVRKHQGHIEVESELGKGTTFHIWLPAAPDKQPNTPEADNVIVAMTGRLLFMDDEETICTMAKSLLTRLGFEVVTVPDGAAAVAAFQKARDDDKPFRLVIMDLTVPGGMGGRDAMQELLKLDPGVRAIVSSGYSSDPVLANYKAHGFRGMVPKPYKITDLARAIRTVLEGK